MTELKYFKRTKAVEDYQASSSVLQIRIDDIRPNRAQPRSDFDNNSIIRLADSIRRYGILQPLTVRNSDEDDIYKYELIAGERRLRAAKALGYFTVPCIIVEADEKMSAEMAIIENLLREDLNMFEQAYGFKNLIDNFNMTQDEVSRKMSLSQSAVANKLRLLKLTYEEQKMIIEMGLTERHARALLKIEDVEQRIEVIHHVSSLKMNVINTEQYIENLLKKATVASEEDSSDQKTYKSEKSINDLVSSFQRKIEELSRSGRNATINVLNSNQSVEVRIKIIK